MNAPRPLVRIGDVVEWSTYHFMAGATVAWTTQRLFGTAWGTVGQGKGTALDFSDTSMKEPCRLPVSMTVRAVGWEIWADDARDADAILQHGVWAWDFTQTLVPGTPLSVDNGHELTAEWQAPTPGRMYTGIYTYETPAVLPSNTHFGIMLRFGDAPDLRGLRGNVRVRFLLFGSYVNHMEVS